MLYRKKAIYTSTSRTGERRPSCCIYNGKIYTKDSLLGEGSFKTAYKFVNEFDKADAVTILEHIVGNINIEENGKFKTVETKDDTTHFLKHEVPFYVAMHSFAEFIGEDKNKMGEPVRLVVPYFDGPTFSKYKVSSTIDFLELTIAILKAIENMHEVEDIIHGDIKGDNFIVSEDKRQNLIVKIFDFSLSARRGTEYEYLIFNADHHPKELKNVAEAPKARTKHDSHGAGVMLYIKYLNFKEFISPLINKKIEAIFTAMCDEEISERLDILDALDKFEKLKKEYLEKLQDDLLIEQKKAEDYIKSHGFILENVQLDESDPIPDLYAKAMMKWCFCEALLENFDPKIDHSSKLSPEKIASLYREFMKGSLPEKDVLSAFQAFLFQKNNFVKTLNKIQKECRIYLLKHLGHDFLKLSVENGEVIYQVVEMMPKEERFKCIALLGRASIKAFVEILASLSDDNERINFMKFLDQDLMKIINTPARLLEVLNTFQTKKKLELLDLVDASLTRHLIDSFASLWKFLAKHVEVEEDYFKFLEQYVEPKKLEDMISEDPVRLGNLFFLMKSNGTKLINYLSVDYLISLFDHKSMDSLLKYLDRADIDNKLTASFIESITRKLIKELGLSQALSTIKKLDNVIDKSFYNAFVSAANRIQREKPLSKGPHLHQHVAETKNQAVPLAITSIKRI